MSLPPFSAPHSLTIATLSASALSVTITPNTDGARVQLYQVSGGGRSCEVSATLSPLKCDLIVLESAKEYVVQAKACTDSSNCGEAQTQSAWTAPDGE